jgi:RhoGEF domain
VISPTLSTSSTYEDQLPELAQHHKHEKHSESSKRHPGPDIQVKDIPDISQKKFTSREAVIQEIFVTEENLLRLLHICMQQFILPLRVDCSRSWITGVPGNIARLLDWFDDIVNLHEQIYQSLCSARDTQSPTTDRVSESLRCFVLKAEVYQPYLIRLPDVSEEISFLMTGSGESDFGQFVNLQEQTSECEGWSFQGLLMLPVHRLSAYQTLFSVGFPLLLLFLMKNPIKVANVFLFFLFF